MRRRVRAVYLMPVGPDAGAPDTLDSILHYAEEPFAVVVLADAEHHRMAAGETVDVLTGPPVCNLEGALWGRLAAGYRYVVENFDFDLVVRIDSDALVTGPGLERAAHELFACDPSIGMLGACRIGPRGARNFAPAAAALSRDMGARNLVRDPRLACSVAWLYLRARRHGYVFGEHPLGACYVHGRRCVEALYQSGWLARRVLTRSNAGDDHLFGMLSYAVGYRTAEFGGANDPLAVTWKGLPAAPEALAENRKLVIHSVKGSNDLSEEQIREFFRLRRQGGQ